MTTEAKLTPAEISSTLRGFTGTMEYHSLGNLFPSLVLTDGAAFLAKEIAGWLVTDIAAVYQCKYRQIPFQVWELKKKEDGTAVLTMKEDSGQPVKYRQVYEWVDFPLNEIKLYVIDGVMLLPSEY